MSASRKKQAQNSLNAAKMTERQLQEQQEAKKLKVMTAAFTAIIALILVVVIAVSAFQFVNNSGIRENNTVAATIGETELSNAQLNYFYVDAVSQFLNTYGSYAAMFGLDVAKPLDEQVTNPETGATWADDFMTTALSNAKAMYALADEAKANGQRSGSSVRKNKKANTSMKKNAAGMAQKGIFHASGSFFFKYRCFFPMWAHTPLPRIFKSILSLVCV